jgi:hypothetical protein
MAGIEFRERFLTRKQAAEILGVKAQTLASWRSGGKKYGPPMRKHGAKAVYALSELFAWSEKQKE